jgi:glycosyltransferase involved in cell wall biosynthesis
MSRASGEYLAFIDADDLWHPLKLAHQLERLQRSPPADACVAYVRNFASGQTAGVIPDTPEPAACGISGYVAGTLLARRSVFERVGPFNAGLWHGATLDWFVRARECGVDVAVIDEVLMYRRLHDANLSRQDAASSRSEHLRVLRDALKRRKVGTT